MRPELRRRVDSNQPVRSHMPDSGPVIFAVRFPIVPGGGTQATPNLSGVQEIRWGRNYRVTGLMGIELDSVNPAVDSTMSLQITTDKGDVLCSDGQNLFPQSTFLNLGAFQLTASTLGLSLFPYPSTNWLRRWLKLDRLVQPGDRWLLRIANVGVEDVRPIVFFTVEELEGLK